MSKQTEMYVCPFCCKTVDVDRFHLVCYDPDCTAKFIARANPTERRMRVSTFRPGREIDVEGSLFRGIDSHSAEALTTPYHIVSYSKDGKCDICRKPLTSRLCPICHGPIPEGPVKESNIIAILGANRSGKSHFTASLIEVLQSDYCIEYNARMEPAVPRTTEVFDILRDRLRDGDYETECTSEPMVYYMTRADGDDVSTHTLAFFDTAAADLESEGHMQAVSTGTLISGAAGLLFLVDPLSLPAVREALKMPPAPMPDYTGRLNEIADTIRLRRHQRKREVDLPLAVVLTKVDALMHTSSYPEEDIVLFGPESALNIPRARGIYDENNLMQIDAEVEEYLRRVAGEDFVKAVGRFNPHAYFAVSALGHEAAPNSVPVPFRVEDPMIWMMNRRK